MFCYTFFKSGKVSFAPLFLKVEKWKSGKVSFAPLFLKVEKVEKVEKVYKNNNLHY